MMQPSVVGALSRDSTTASDTGLLLIADNQESLAAGREALASAGHPVCDTGLLSDRTSAAESGRQSAVVLVVQCATQGREPGADDLVATPALVISPRRCIVGSTAGSLGLDQLATEMMALDLARAIVSREPREDDPGSLDATQLQATDKPATHKPLLPISIQASRIQEQERRKLSLELHDDIAQLFGNLVLMIDACLGVATSDEAKLRKYLTEARENAKEGFRRLRNFSTELHPPILEDLGLAAAIAWYVERFVRQTGMDAKVQMGKRVPRVDADCEIGLFRIMQEALNNIGKHAKASQATISLKHLDGFLVLSVTDDGIGFANGDVRANGDGEAHLGMAGMKYRAQLLGGTVDIASSPGAGTSVTARIPVSPARLGQDP